MQQESRESTGSHAAEVVALARLVGEQLGLEAAELTQLELAASLSGIGKLAVDDAVLRKPGPLDSEDWALVRRLPERTADQLTRIPGLAPTAAVVRFHRERWDGGGYPHGIEGEQIPFASRIVGACDAYRAMVEDRPYRRGLSHDHAVLEVRRGSGSQFDPVVVDALLAVVEAGAASTTS
jgi:HD-GYP domain-containing protein (c-di-GMP phosphodiesterase class II)